MRYDRFTVATFFIILLFHVSAPVSAQNADDLTVNSITYTINIENGSHILWGMSLDVVNEGDTGIDEITLVLNSPVRQLTAKTNGSNAALFSTINEDQTTITITFARTLSSGSTYSIEIQGQSLLDLTTVEDGSFQFLYNWDTNLDSTNISITILLPIGSRVHRNDADDNIFPGDGKYDSDGQRIIISWTGLSDIDTTNTKLFIHFDQPLSTGTANPNNSGDTNWVLFVVIGILLLILAGSAYYNYYQYRELTEFHDKSNEHTTKVVETIKPIILTPQEMEILKIIHKFDDGIDQSELVKVLSLSKARISQYLSDFEEKGLIKKIKMGRKNHIVLNADIEEITG